MNSPAIYAFDSYISAISQKLTIINSTFSDCNAIMGEGGAVSLTDMDLAIFNSSFEANEAYLNGGSLFLSCSETNLKSKGFYLS